MHAHVASCANVDLATPRWRRANEDRAALTVRPDANATPGIHATPGVNDMAAMMAARGRLEDEGG
jgi:hypothetical protein